jgi:hypothetical protein
MALVLADFIAAVHLGFVAFVIVAQVVILVGVAARWRWVRNPWFRVTHLVMIGVVAFEAMVDFECPLTTWENNLRASAGQQVEAGQTFIGRLVDSIMFFRDPTVHQIIDMSYVGFALLVVATFLLAPPRWRKKPVAKAISCQNGEAANNGVAVKAGD